MAWRSEWGPSAWSKFRVPPWMVGEKRVDRARAFEGLRRRMEGEASSSSIDRNRNGEPRNRAAGNATIDQTRNIS